MPFAGGNHSSASIVLNKIHLDTAFDADSWGRPQPQPTILSVQVECSIASAVTEDDYSQTLDYSALNKDLRRLAAPEACSSLPAFQEAVVELVRLYNSERPRITRLDATLLWPEALHNSTEGVTCQFSIFGGKEIVLPTLVRLGGLNVPCIIGIKERERLVKQTLCVSIELQVEILYTSEGPKSPLLAFDWKQQLARHVFERMSESTFQTAEAAAGCVGKLVDEYFKVIAPANPAQYEIFNFVWLLSVSVLKPSAISGVEGAGVTLKYSDYPRPMTDVSRVKER